MDAQADMGVDADTGVDAAAEGLHAGMGVGAAPACTLRTLCATYLTAAHDRRWLK